MEEASSHTCKVGSVNMSLISKDIKETVRAYKELIGPERNFDILNKQMMIGERLVEFFMIDGFVKDDIMEKLLESFLSIKKEFKPRSLNFFIKKIKLYLLLATKL